MIHTTHFDITSHVNPKKVYAKAGETIKIIKTIENVHIAKNINTGGLFPISKNKFYEVCKIAIDDRHREPECNTGCQQTEQCGGINPGNEKVGKRSKTTVQDRPDTPQQFRLF